jgi:hypothetical protein
VDLAGSLRAGEREVCAATAAGGGDAYALRKLVGRSPAMRIDFQHH